jgi:hypothetical protein
VSLAALDDLGPEIRLECRRNCQSARDPERGLRLTIAALRVASDVGVATFVATPPISVRAVQDKAPRDAGLCREFRMVRLGGFEPPTVGLEVRCSSAELQARANNRVSPADAIRRAAAGDMRGRGSVTPAARLISRKSSWPRSGPDFRLLTDAEVRSHDRDGTTGVRSRR